ncbi:hypothetical protein [Streptomyces erythrochromogenes]|uniref:hypothetical protein n=1 Tax=Streptomyces erythrochromogenes TaxID=285574 RepID=UPI003677AECD
MGRGTLACRLMRSVTFCAQGILVKSLNGRYLPWYRGWTKIRRRDTTEAIAGAITGTLTRPQLLVLGRDDTEGRLRAVGRTVPLRPDAARQVAEHLTAAAQEESYLEAAWRYELRRDRP